MSRQFFAVVAVALWLCGPGCRSAHLKMDQDCMRAALLDLYTNQIMDNLIRASNGYPIVQLDYSDITGTVTQNANASYGGNQTLQTARNELGVTTLRQFTNFFEYSIGGSQENQLTITANPVLNNNEVYNAYLEYLEKPERFIASDEPPPPWRRPHRPLRPGSPVRVGMRALQGQELRHEDVLLGALRVPLRLPAARLCLMKPCKVPRHPKLYEEARTYRPTVGACGSLLPSPSPPAGRTVEG